MPLQASNIWGAFRLGDQQPDRWQTYQTNGSEVEVWIIPHEDGGDKKKKKKDQDRHTPRTFWLGYGDQEAQKVQLRYSSIAELEKCMSRLDDQARQQGPAADASRIFPLWRTGEQISIGNAESLGQSIEFWIKGAVVAWLFRALHPCYLGSACLPAQECLNSKAK